MTIHPETFKLLLKKSGLNQAALADKAGVSVKTIGRIKKGTHQSAATTKRIADALKTTIEILAAPPAENAGGSSDVPSFQRLNVYISDETRDAFNLVDARYAVSAGRLVNLAPLLFTVLAEMSLDDRLRRVTEFEADYEAVLAKAPRDLLGDEGRWSDMHSGVREAIAREKASIESRTIRSSANDSEEAWLELADPDLFVNYLNRLAHGLRHKVASNLADNLDYLDYELLGDELDQITNGDAWARFALDGGFVAVSDIPDALRQEDRASERAAWLAGKVPAAVRASAEEADARYAEEEMVERELRYQHDKARGGE